MATTFDLFNLALQYHQAGDLRQAEGMYRQILQADPSHADSHHLLGVIAYQTGQFEAAVPPIRHALTLNPWAVVYHSNLGLCYEALGRIADAVACYEQALRLQPESPEMHNALGNTLQQIGRVPEAEAHCRHALRMRANYSAALNNLGNALLRQNRLDEAIATYEQALRVEPNHPEAHANLGLALANQGRREQALAHYREALRLNPSYAEAYNNLANLLREQWKLDEAIDCYREALRLNPNYAEAHNNLGIAIRGGGKLADAIECYRQALRIRPSYGEAHSNLGNALKDDGQIDEAGWHFEEALRLRPDNAEAHWNRSLLWLLCGDFELGWPEYEWRWTQPGFVPQSYPQPRWDGSDLAGRTILVYAEQGLGDTLQFVRYTLLLQQRGARVLMGCSPALVRLLASCPGIHQVVPTDSALPPFDTHVALLSLPALLRTTLETIPADVPYLAPPADLAAEWRGRLGESSEFTVGIAWQGNPGHAGDRRRSVPLSYFESLSRLPGVRLVSLQKGAGSEQVEALGGRFPVRALGPQLADFADTAAVIQHLDLVVTVDSAVAHLAGALNVPVWVALPHAADWRWLLEREDSPWYPSMRLFRQRQPGDWPEVFARITRTLQDRLVRREKGS